VCVYVRVRAPPSLPLPLPRLLLLLPPFHLQQDLELAAPQLLAPRLPLDLGEHRRLAHMPHGCRLVYSSRRPAAHRTSITVRFAAAMILSVRTTAVSPVTPLDVLESFLSASPLLLVELV